MRAAGESSFSRDSFATTRWSLIRAAGQADSDGAAEALETLCAAYWYPLYAYVRRRGHQPAEAQDLTQSFFAQLLEGKLLPAADQQRGRFRSFLLQSFKNFQAAQRRRQTAQKRGGRRRTLPLDFTAGEDRYLLEPVDAATPERLFERRWALTLLEETLARLRGEYQACGRDPLFAALEPHLHGGPDSLPFAELARRLDMSEGAIKVAAHRLRRRYRDLLRQHVADTVSSAEEVDQELRELLSALSVP